MNSNVSFLTLSHFVTWRNAHAWHKIEPYVTDAQNNKRSLPSHDEVGIDSVNPQSIHFSLPGRFRMASITLPVMECVGSGRFGYFFCSCDASRAIMVKIVSKSVVDDVLGST